MIWMFLLGFVIVQCVRPEQDSAPKLGSYRYGNGRLSHLIFRSLTQHYAGNPVPKYIDDDRDHLSNWRDAALGRYICGH